jgi:hypothetical protein
LTGKDLFQIAAIKFEEAAATPEGWRGSKY